MGSIRHRIGFIIGLSNAIGSQGSTDCSAGAAPPGSAATTAVPPRIYSRVDTYGETPTEKHPRHAANALAARSRDGRGARLPAGGTSRRSGCATDRGGRPTASPLPATRCLRSGHRPGFRRSAAVTGYPSFVLNIACPCGPCGPASGRPERTADADRAAGRQKWYGASASDQRIVERCQPWRYGIRSPPNTLEDPEMRSGFWTERQGRGRCDVSSRADRFEAGVVVSAPCADGASRGPVSAIK